MNDNIDLSTRHRRRRSSSSSSLSSLAAAGRGGSAGSLSGGGGDAPSSADEEEGGEGEEEEELLFDETEAIGHGHVRVGGDGRVVAKAGGGLTTTERSPLLSGAGERPPSPARVRHFFGPESVPLLLFLSDLVISMSSGMTLRYARGPLPPPARSSDG